MKKIQFVLPLLFLWILGCSSSDTTNDETPEQAQTAVGGAHILKPFAREVTGGQCLLGKGNNAGNAAFGFPQRMNLTAALSFTLGPLTNSPGQEKNVPYAGAGHYSNVGILIRPEKGNQVFGYGTIVVNDDLQTGSFELNDHGASGTWDCGSRIR